MRAEYFADDGKQFDTMEECLEYEKFCVRPIVKGIKFMDKDYKLLDTTETLENDYHMIEYIYADSEKSIEAFSEWFYDYYGDIIKPMGAGWYSYCSIEQGFVSVNKQITELKAEIKRLESLDEKLGETK